MLSDDEIIEHVTQSEDRASEDEDENEETQGILTPGEAAEILDECLLWYEQ